MPHRIANRLNSALERWLPEQRLFLKSETSTRFVRLRPMTQAAALGGTAIVLSWSIVASSVLVIDAVGAGSSREQAARTQAALESRLNTLSQERDTRAAEAAAAQERFAVALDQVSQMQSQLLAAEERKRELETGLGVVQASLHDALVDRDKARKLAAATTEQAAEAQPQAARAEEFSVALDILSDELASTAVERQLAERRATDASRKAEEMAVERDQLVARTDEIFAQLEDAVELSVKPLDEMIRNVGVDSDKLLETVREGYSGQGGPLTPMGYSTRGNAAISESEARAKEIVVSLDKVNRYRIAVSRLPLAMPVKSAFRYSSGFGPRWGRKHQGLDMAGPVGTPIFATGDGVVTFAGWQRGYGNLIKIEHELGTETRYAHLSKIRVKAGQKVSRNSQIGDMGNTGRSTGSHLHYEVRVNGQAVNPMSFIKAAENVF
ncbi:M23 family metallopeptidase [uncultured Paracoccus sp.]|uniref:M23 family metallopeptidase n=1 Tax=uncultured Paracoccus sp. TaxID=189685 RepID=UPI0026370B09|nr:M23 family metallopeptidase [uncultured Paracoccus sp.]